MKGFDRISTEEAMRSRADGHRHEPVEAVGLEVNKVGDLVKRGLKMDSRCKRLVMPRLS